MPTFIAIIRDIVIIGLGCACILVLLVVIFVAVSIIRALKALLENVRGTTGEVRTPRAS